MIAVVVDNTPVGWPTELAKRLGRSIATARKAKGLSASKLAEATAFLGAPVNRIAIPKIERGEQVVSVTELVALAVALDSKWDAWLTEAVDRLPIEERVHYRALLSDIDRQIDTQRRNLFQAEEGLKHFDMPDDLRERIAANVQRYRETLESLESQRKMIVSMLGTPGA
jgi:transcriptional regulator with XRE-family HTH domain